jgi:hypothetical protein
LQAEGRVIQDATTGDYGKEGYVVQELALLPNFQDERNVSHYAVLGLWFVDGEVAGLGIREDETPITANGSKFIPHSIKDGPVNYERQPIPDLDEIEALLSIEQYADAGDKSGDLLDYIERVVQQDVVV